MEKTENYPEYRKEAKAKRVYSNTQSIVAAETGKMVETSQSYENSMNFFKSAINNNLTNFTIPEEYKVPDEDFVWNIQVVKPDILFDSLDLLIKQISQQVYSF